MAGSNKFIRLNSEQLEDCLEAASTLKKHGILDIESAVELEAALTQAVQKQKLEGKSPQLGAEA
eukprot:3855246-Amphidinium_carterae.1